MTTLDKAEAALFALRTSTRREQVKAVVNALKGSLALSETYQLDRDMTLNWNAALDRILEEGE
jgi:hypothetical protein